MAQRRVTAPTPRTAAPGGSRAGRAQPCRSRGPRRKGLRDDEGPQERILHEEGPQYPTVTGSVLGEAVASPVLQGGTVLHAEPGEAPQGPLADAALPSLPAPRISFS